MKIRQVIAYRSEQQADEFFDGSIELDESYFGGQRKGKRSRSAAGKVACYKSYNVLDVSEFNHFRINHSTHFAEQQNHINGIENFWGQAKHHLRKFNGIPKEHFELYLKECEWRFNHSEIKSLVLF